MKLNDKHNGMTAIKICQTVIGMFVVKFLIFDLIWAFGSTFSGFQFPIGYLTKLAFATLLASPLLITKSKWYVGVMGIIIDLWLIANLMYFRTYYTIIPATSYTLVGNLNDFQDSVWESLRGYDILFPLTTIATMAMLWRTKIADTLRAGMGKAARTMGIAFAVPMAIVGIYLVCKGGYKEAYDDLMYDFPTCGAAVYTIPGAMCYEFMNGSVEMTPEVNKAISEWLDKRPSNAYTPVKIEARDNTIIILCESLESWPIKAVIEDQEITPNLNKLIADSTTLYVPNVLTQVRGARSIDAQLILHTGLLPVSYGAYSYRFTQNTYPSLDKAWKEKYGDEARSLSFTVDKKTVWNVAIVANLFGYEIYDKPNFKLDVKTGPRGRLGDDSFLRQSLEKISTEEHWKTGGHTMLQCVTYSGHTPFVIPEELKEVHFTEAIPERLRHYLEVANYTDRAIGEFISGLRKNKKFDNTMIVITGDHECIGIDRYSYVKNKEISKWLSKEQYVPFIVVNSPISGHYNEVIGQVDLYPTLLDLMGLNEYSWHGLGQSLFDTARAPFAVSAQGKVSGNASKVTDDDIRYKRKAFDISDLMICCDYFKKN